VSWIAMTLTEFPLHPMFVHFPVALLTTALLFQFLAAWRRSARFADVARWLLYLGTLGALAAVTTGFIAADELGHDSPGHELVHAHRNLAVVTTVLAVLACFAYSNWGKSDSLRARWGLTAALLAVVVVLALGAEKGGSMVYKYGTGVRWETPPPAETGHEHGEHEH